MAHERKNGLTVAEKDVLWARFKNGESFVAIARALDRRVSSIYSVVREHGGVAPAIRRRAQSALTLSDRETISRGLSAGQSVRGMADGLGRAPSTISREITRNGGPDRYRAVAADARAWRTARRPQPSRMATHHQELTPLRHEELTPCGEGVVLASRCLDAVRSPARRFSLRR